MTSVRVFAAGLSLLLIVPLRAAAAGPTVLDRYLEDLHTLRTTFTQTLTDAHGHELDRSTGTLLVSRPGKFRWELIPQGTRSSLGTLMVADGRNVWFFDRDLQQVTVKPFDAALSATPAMLLTGVADIRSNFNVTDESEREGLAWVSVQPRTPESDFRRARLGLARGELKRMVLEDKLGQTATIVFDTAVRNGPIAAEDLTFTPPPGADLIGTPRP